MADSSPAGLALVTQGLSKRFGALEVVSNVNLSLGNGVRHALIGPNGAGKTTLINLITGRYEPSSGRIFLRGDDVTSLSVHQRVHRGLARTFQLNTLLRSMTVLENVQLAVLEQMGVGWKIFGGSDSQRIAAETAYEVLRQLRMEDQAGRQIKELAYGRQRLVEIAIALALKPSLLLLDEPAAGVPPADSHLVFDTLAALPADISLLIVEHDMKLVFRFADRVSVLVQGKVICEGTPSEISQNEMVRRVYLGSRGHLHA